jgi:hypothetical protein
LNVIYHPDGRVSFRADAQDKRNWEKHFQEFLDWLKTEIPIDERKYDPKTQTWYVDGDIFDGIKRAYDQIVSKAKNRT